jgi:Flp pilus assembly protein TadG
MQFLNLFKKDERGTTAVMFGLAILPVLGFAGAAIDYSRATSVKALLQNGVDATAVQLARHAKTTTARELSERGSRLFASVIGVNPQLALSNLAIERIGDEIQVQADAAIPNAFMGLFGFDRTTVSVRSQATAGGKTIELALVLDNTGSMSELGRMTELKIASRNLLNALNKAAPDDDTIRVSIVPFDYRVRVDASPNRYAPWMRFASQQERDNWRGFVIDRDQPYDIDATLPNAASPETLYPAEPAGSYSRTLATAMPLTSVVTGYSSLLGKIESMVPNDCTNITIGASWGLDGLTPGGALPGAKPASTDGLEKIMILLTDGDNTKSRTATSCGARSARTMDPRTTSACDSAKRAGVLVYTVRLTEGNEALLRNCASVGKNGVPLYYNVQNASDLDGVFQQIVNQILATRLTH